MIDFTTIRHLARGAAQVLCIHHRHLELAHLVADQRHFLTYGREPIPPLCA